MDIQSMSPLSKRAKLEGGSGTSSVAQLGDLSMDDFSPIDISGPLINSVHSIFSNEPRELTLSEIRTLSLLYSHLESEAVRKLVMPKLDLWTHLPERYRAELFFAQPKLGKMFAKSVGDNERNNFFFKLVKYVANEVALDTPTYLPLIDLIRLLLLQLPTRRILRPLVVSEFLSVLVPSLAEVIWFPIDDFTGETIDVLAAQSGLYEKIKLLYFHSGRTDLAVRSNRDLFGSPEKVRNLVFAQKILTDVFHLVERDERVTQAFLIQHLVPMERPAVRTIPNEVNILTLSDTSVLMTPQFLNMSDFTHRASHLYMRDFLETLRDRIRAGICAFDEKNVVPKNFAKIQSFNFPTKINRTSLSILPSQVAGELLIDLSGMAPLVAAEWDAQLRVGEVMFVVARGRSDSTLFEGSSIGKVTGVWITEVADGQGNVIDHAGDSVGPKRIIKFCVEPAEMTVSDIFGQNAVLMKLRPGESTFRSVTQQLREGAKLPAWFVDSFLGYAGFGKGADPEEQKFCVETFTPGMHLLHAPPHTGKSEVLGAIVAGLINYGKRVLVVSKSNEHLTSLLKSFTSVPSERIMKLGGAQTEEFSRTDRINYLLSIRLRLLQQVSEIAVKMGYSPAEASTCGYNCDNAKKFFMTRVKPAEQLWRKTVQDNLHTDVSSLLLNYMENNNTIVLTCLKRMPEYDSPSDKGLTQKEIFLSRANRLANLHSLEELINPFGGLSYEKDILPVFEKLSETEPFEILRTVRDRSEYLTRNFAQVIAVTSSGVASQIPHLRECVVDFDTVIIDEAQQMTEVETYLGITAASGEGLNRILLVGDLARIGPVGISDNCREKNFHQTLLRRMHKLGARSHFLTKVRECNPAISNIWIPRYNELSVYRKNPLIAVAEDLMSVISPFMHAAQFLDVQEYQGKGELEPSAHFYQNLAEAEYIVGLFLLLRLKNVPASEITVLTAYSGQKLLIEDIVKAKSNEVLGSPREISTIDQFQGMTNKIVLVSLVRTEHAGHLADSKRWISAVTSATHGLYLFGRLQLFNTLGDEQIQQIIKSFGSHAPNQLILNLDRNAPITIRDPTHMLEVVQNEMRSVYNSIRR